jgi:hypothetical protein
VNVDERAWRILDSWFGKCDISRGLRKETIEGVVGGVDVEISEDEKQSDQS